MFSKSMRLRALFRITAKAGLFSVCVLLAGCVVGPYPARGAGIYLPGISYGISGGLGYPYGFSYSYSYPYYAPYGYGWGYRYYPRRNPYWGGPRPYFPHPRRWR